jgi:hypothetical protein
MTPKQEYEARKAARREKKLDANAKESEMVDLLDRFVTAAERIADALERPQLLPTSNLTFDQNSASGFRVANTFGK